MTGEEPSEAPHRLIAQELGEVAGDAAGDAVGEVLDVVLVGGGGHASDVLGALEAAGFHDGAGRRVRPIGFVDDGTPPLARFAGRNLPNLGPVDELARLRCAWVLAVGWPRTRRSLAERLARIAPGLAPPITVVHPAAVIGTGVVIEAGAVVLATAVCSPLVRIGPHALVHNGAVLGHDTVVGAYASVMPRAVVGGDATVGEGAVVAIGATVLEGRIVGAWATVGAGAVAVSDVRPGIQVLGVPARPRVVGDAP
jgi:sugar O-acyltransferase (sialic acid O-acetyltransferase NeuD family)